MRTKTSLRAAVLALAAALLAACGSDGSPSGGDPAAAEGTPQSGGSMTLLTPSEPRTLDPAAVSNYLATTTVVGNSLYGQLLTVEDGEIRYGLAESLSTSDGGTTWTLKLRDGLTFSNGTPLDAAAVQFNWERVKDPAVGSSGRGGASFVSTMAPSGQTLDFTLTRPIARFQNVIAQEQLNWIGEPQALQAGPQAFDANPIGAGPFVLKSWTRGGELVLERNPNYYDSPRPYLDELVLRTNTDAGQRFATVQSGGADGTLSSNPDLAARAAEEGLEISPIEGGDTNMFRFNTRMAPFDDVRARRAVVQGIDTQAVNEVVNSGFGTVPETVFPEGSEWNGDAELLGYDPEAAQELFDELAAEGKPVEFTINSFPSTESRRAAEAMQAQLNQYDHVAVEVEVLDNSAALALTVQRTFVFTLGAFSSDPVSLYQTLNSESSGNFSGISDPELDAALEDLLIAADDDALNEAYQRVAERYSELALDVFLVRDHNAVVHTDRVHGVKFYARSAIRTDELWVSE